MRKIFLYEVVLREGDEAPGFALSPRQKVEIAHHLVDMGVNTIEVGFPANRDHDYSSVKEISISLRGVEVSALARIKNKDIESAVDALDKAETPVIFTFCPGIDSRLEVCNLSESQAIDQTGDAVRLARQHIDHVAYGVEFTPESYQNKREFMRILYTTALAAGATRLVICDSSGCMLPRQSFELANWIKTNIKGDYRLVMHSHNDLSNAVQNSVEGIFAGVDEIHVAALGLGERAGNTDLAALSAALSVHQDLLEVITDLNYTQVIPSIHRIAEIFGYIIPPNTPVVGRNAFATQAGIHIASRGANGGDPFLRVLPGLYGVDPSYYSGPHSGKYNKGPRLPNPKDRDATTFP
ncbi:MAG: hypothetical protein KKC75_07135 [Nanoarchaeota archaeon]|nr:hypothetical protein [Nanoarchaeota archaeon]MBU1005462.1 hypothetical protein [Nanoarchaeota archaeon]MBU1947032.1 hypothetical protein [Nanoarchaeota archaeon]